MGCSFSGLNALYDSVNSGGDAWINENRFRIVRQLGEGGFAYVYLVKELINDSAAGGLAKKLKDSSHISGSFHSFTSLCLLCFVFFSTEIDLLYPDLCDLCCFLCSYMRFYWSVMAFPRPTEILGYSWRFNFGSVSVSFWFELAVLECLWNTGVGGCGLFVDSVMQFCWYVAFA